MELQKVLNGKVFATNIPNEFCMASLFYVVIIKQWNHHFEPRVPYLEKPEMWEFY